MVLKIEPDRPVRPVQQLVGHGFGPIRWIGPESGRTRIGSGEPTVRSANQTIQPFFFFYSIKKIQNDVPATGFSNNNSNIKTISSPNKPTPAAPQLQSLTAPATTTGRQAACRWRAPPPHTQRKPLFASTPRVSSTRWRHAFSVVDKLVKLKS